MRKKHARICALMLRMSQTCKARLVSSKGRPNNSACNAIVRPCVTCRSFNCNLSLGCTTITPKVACVWLQNAPRQVVTDSEELTDGLKTQVLFAREYLKDVSISEKQVERLVMEASRGACQGHRSELFAARVAMASAALDVSLSLHHWSSFSIVYCLCEESSLLLVCQRHQRLL